MASKLARGSRGSRVEMFRSGSRSISDPALPMSPDVVPDRRKLDAQLPNLPNAWTLSGSNDSVAWTVGRIDGKR
jgi:hypothetical protein